MQTKKCRKCKSFKSLWQFQPMNIWKYWVASTCKSCNLVKVFATNKTIKQVSKKNKNTPANFSSQVKWNMIARDWWCIICRKRNNLQCHHAYFWASSNLTETRNDLDQWVCLCPDCHFETHNWTAWRWKDFRQLCIDHLNKLYK